MPDGLNTAYDEKIIRVTCASTTMSRA